MKAIIIIIALAFIVYLYSLANDYPKGEGMCLYQGQLFECVKGGEQNE